MLPEIRYRWWLVWFWPLIALLVALGLLDARRILRAGMEIE